MAERIVQEESLISVADAIRAKGGTNGALSFPTGFKTAIEAIEIGGKQETPVIAVSESGLITATAGDKSATKQLSTQSGKTITPGPTEQIAVAAGMFVTEDVIVAAVQSGGGGSGGDGSAYLVNIPVTISASVSVTVEKYYTHALYNGVRLPRIPDSVLESYPYVFIRHNTTSGYYEMYCATGITYHNQSQSRIEFSTSTARQRYRIAIAGAETATAWESNGTSTATVTIDSARPVLWSNHDIPSGSASSTTIYFEGTDPVPTD